MTLQECEICEDGQIKLTHKYFGAKSCCENCRGFFKRVAVKIEEAGVNDLPSLENCTGKCSFVPPKGDPEAKKNFRRCQSCCYRRCVNVGMSLNNGRFRTQETTTNKQAKPASKSKISSSVKKSKLSLKGTKNKKEAIDTKTSSEFSRTDTESSSPDVAEEIPTELEPKIPCVASLHNLGNTCFLNSVVQVLRYTPHFEESLQTLANQVKITDQERCLIAQLEEDNQMENEGPEKDLDRSPWDVVKHLNAVFNKMNKAENNFMNGSHFIGTRPYDLIDIIGQLNPMFEGNHQQDAHEFMRCLLAYIQDASRSINKYRQKSAESLGRAASGDYVTEPVSLHGSPIKVEMRGGVKDHKKNSPPDSKPVARTSKRLSDSGAKCENKGEKMKSPLKSPNNKLTRRGRKSLTELQNHEIGQRSILDCYTVTMQSNGVTDEGTQRWRMSGKRKADTEEEDETKQNDSSDSGDDAQTSLAKPPLNRKKRRFHSAQKQSTGKSQPKLDNSTETSPHSTHKEHGQGDNKYVEAQIITKTGSPKKQTARKSFGSAKIDIEKIPGKQDEEPPVTKEAVIKLDKNGIAKYFQKVKPESSCDIERHVDPIADCIEEIFQGQVELQTRCCECENISGRREEYQDISVAVKREKLDETDAEGFPQVKTNTSGLVKSSNTTSEISQQDVIDVESTNITMKNNKAIEDESVWVRESLNEVEKLVDDNKYYCESCCHLTEAQRSIHYMSVPRILTLHLKRFAMSHGGSMFTKLTDHVPLPILLPCIEDNCTQPEQHQLQLYGVITHTGYTLSCGHYTAYIRAPDYSVALNDPDIIKQANEGHQEHETVDHTVITNTEMSSLESDAADPNNNADDNNNCDREPASTPDDDVQYWFECDDEYITVIREDDLLARLGPRSSNTTTPYLLFYQRVQ